MTPQERAENIRTFMAGLTHNKNPSIADVDELIIMHINEAVREAVEWKIKEMLSDHYLLAHFYKGRDEGFAAAREKAAGIALETNEPGMEDYCGDEIAERIRKLEADK